MTSGSPGAMTVRVKVGRGLERFVSQTDLEMRVPTGTRIRDIIDMLCIPQGEVTIISRNGALAGKEDALQDGDALRLYPPIGGGA